MKPYGVRRMLPGIIFFSLFITGCALVSGCTTSKKIGQVLMNPDIEVGSTADQPSVVDITLLSEPDINKNESDTATPLEIQVIYLIDDSKLLATDYDQLNAENSDISKILSKNYIDHQSYTLLPGQFKKLPLIKLKEDNHFIGVIAYYADENVTEWKKITKIEGVGHRYHLLIHAREKELELQKEEE